jgi:hypothetical protein
MQPDSGTIRSRRVILADTSHPEGPTNPTKAGLFFLPIQLLVNGLGRFLDEAFLLHAQDIFRVRSISKAPAIGPPVAANLSLAIDVRSLERPIV